VTRSRFDGYEAIRNMTADVLGHLGVKITIKGMFTAAKRRAPLSVA
jgi:hypothetical protein